MSSASDGALRNKLGKVDTNESQPFLVSRYSKSNSIMSVHGGYRRGEGKDEYVARGQKSNSQGSLFYSRQNAFPTMVLRGHLGAPLNGHGQKTIGIYVQ